MQISIIVAIAKDLAIGYQNNLLFHLPNDMKRFKELTTGHTVIMGRRTFESLPKGALPNRRNIVLSTTGKAGDFPGAELFHSINEALADCRQRAEISEEKAPKVFIIGGASVYQEALPLANMLNITCVDAAPQEADTYFPEIAWEDWKEISREHHDADEKHAQAYDFVDLIRR